MSDKNLRTVVILFLTIVLIIVLIRLLDGSFQQWGCSVGYFVGDKC